MTALDPETRAYNCRVRMQSAEHVAALAQLSVRFGP